MTSTKTSVSETGHAKNAANFQTLISHCTAFGLAYNPSKPELQITSLESLLTNAQAEIANVAVSKNNFTSSTSQRQQAFAPLKQLCTRIFNFISATESSEYTIADARTINNKLQGRRSKPIPKSTPEEGGDTPTPKHISVSRQSYDMLIANFAEFISLLSIIPSYTPNEADLQITSLKNYLENLKTSNTNLIIAEVNYNNTRMVRDKVLYANQSGLIDIALSVKKYVKAIFGSTSTEYKQISNLAFQRPRD